MTELADIEFETPGGDTKTLADYAGEVLLVVNVASKCGLTPQYEALQTLYADKSDQGFRVLAFPANNFGGQEPGTDDEIAEFCSVTYDVTFPVFSKISVVGDDQHPLYAALTEAMPTAPDKGPMRDRLSGVGMTPNEDPDVLWNFEKFLIGADGSVVGRFSPSTPPDDPTLLAAIDAQLANGSTGG